MTNETSYRVVVGEKGNDYGHIIQVGGTLLVAAEATLARELRAYQGDGWGRIECSYDGGQTWERMEVGR